MMKVLCQRYCVRGTVQRYCHRGTNDGGTVTEVLLRRYYLLGGTVSEVLCRGTVLEVL